MALPWPDVSSAAIPSSATRTQERPVTGFRHSVRALRHRNYALFWAGALVSNCGTWIQNATVPYVLYQLTGSTLWVGLSTFAQFLPSVAFSPLGGSMADRFDRRRVLLACYAVLTLCAGALLVLCSRRDLPVWPIYVVLVGIGVARAFAGPASQALVPHLVPGAHFPNAVSWSSSVFQVGTITGPVVGGVIYGASGGAPAVFAVCTGALVLATCAIAGMHVRTGRMATGPASWGSLVAGIRYVWQQKKILGSISLDLFAVLLGGATALLPVYARDILHVGPWGLGILRSAPAVGAALMAVYLAHWPLQRRAGAIMLGCVALFGVATIVFGVSHSFGVSLLALAVLGASDQVSVVTRLTLVQVATPPEMRGRVGAVNMVFIGASNELGEFESGVTADWLGVVRAVVLGGVGTLVVVVLWAWWFPELRKIDRVDQVT